MEEEVQDEHDDADHEQDDESVNNGADQAEDDGDIMITIKNKASIVFPFRLRP